MKWDEHFYYDESSPSCLRWKVDVYTGKDDRIRIMCAGDVAGCIDYDCRTNLRYWRVGLHNRLYSVHRIVWEMTNGGIQVGLKIDHKDGNGLNNLTSNLRLVPHTKNMRNKTKDKRNTSGATGVSLDRGYWRGQYIDLAGNRIRKCFSIKLHGDEGAFILACKWREEMIEELNRQGAGYTERHGT